MVCLLGGSYFVIEASSICSNVLLSLEKNVQYMFLCSLGIIQIVIWMTQQKEFYGRESSPLN